MQFPLLVRVISCYLIAVARAELPSFSLENLEIPRQKGFVPISYSNVTIGTTELFVACKSHGNPPPGRRNKPSTIEGGGWTKAIDAGDDDKSVEVWFRYIATTQHQTDLGQFNSRYASGKTVVRLVFEGRIDIGNAVGERQDKGCVRIENFEPGPYLVIFSSDSSGDSDLADAKLKVGTDNPTFFYVVENGMFEDNTLGRRYGAITSIQLLTEVNSTYQFSQGPTNVAPNTDICSEKITSCRYQCRETCNPSIGECPSDAVCIRRSHYFGYRCDPPSFSQDKCSINAIKCKNLKEPPKPKPPTSNPLVCNENITSCRYKKKTYCNFSTGECPLDAVCIRKSNTYGFRCESVESDGNCKSNYSMCKQQLQN